MAQIILEIAEQDSIRTINALADYYGYSGPQGQPQKLVYVEDQMATEMADRVVSQEQQEAYIDATSEPPDITGGDGAPLAKIRTKR